MTTTHQRRNGGATPATTAGGAGAGRQTVDMTAADFKFDPSDST